MIQTVIAALGEECFLDLTVAKKPLILVKINGRRSHDYENYLKLKELSKLLNLLG